MRYLLVLVVLLASLPAIAAELPTTETQTLREQLVLDEQELPGRISRLTPDQATEEVMQAARLAAQAAQLAVEKTQAALAGAQTNLQTQAQLASSLQQRLSQWLESPEPSSVPVMPGSETKAEVQARLAATQQAIQQEQTQLTQLQERLSVQQRQLKLSQRWEQALQQPHQLYQQQQLVQRIRTERQRYLEEAEQLREEWQQLQWSGADAQPHLLQTRIQLAEVRAELASHALRYNYAQTQLQNWRGLLGQTPQQVGGDQVREAQQLERELRASRLALEQQARLLRQQGDILQQTTANLTPREQTLAREEQRLLAELRQILEQQLAQLVGLQPGLSALHEALASTARHNFTTQLRQQRNLPQTWELWQRLLMELGRLPGQIGHELTLLFNTLTQTLQQLTLEASVLLAALILAWGGLAFQGYRWTQRCWQRLHQVRTVPVSALTLLAFLALANALACWLGLGLGALMFWLNPGGSAGYLGGLLAALPLALRLPPTLLWGVFHLGLTQSEQTRQLYRRLSGLWWFTASSGLLTLLAHLLAASQEVQELLGTLFMGLLGVWAWPVIQLRQLLLAQSTLRLAIQWRIALQLGSLVLATALIMLALLGLLGYLQLGWFLAKHLSLILVFLLIWLSLRSLLLDGLHVLHARLLGYNRLTGFLAEDLLPLLSLLLRLLLLGSLLWGLFYLNGWLDDQNVLGALRQAFTYPLYSNQNVRLTVTSVLLAALTVWFVVWFSRLAKRLGYWWLYEGVSDLGVRNSLASFTQYTLLVGGLMIALQVMGVNLTTLMVLLGGLGVGIGFGLQNVASNFISGILLLIERPVRTGDIVSIAGQEGRITSLGIRSVTLQNWDMHDVIIPNSELISSSFTNFTLSNKTLRLMLIIGIGYDDDPHQARQIMREVVTSDSEVLKEPEPAVIFWEYGDSALLFRLYLYIDSSRTGLGAVRDRILFTLWDRFKAAGISIPYPQRTVHVKPWPGAIPGQPES